MHSATGGGGGGGGGGMGKKDKDVSFISFKWFVLLFFTTSRVFFLKKGKNCTGSILLNST